MSPSPQLADTIENTQSTPRGGPRTDTGKANSSKNAAIDSQPNSPALSPLSNCRRTDTCGQNGLFTAQDFIRPGEESLYSSLDESLRKDLAPAGMLEHNLVDEIRRAMWRLRRCGHIEETFATSEFADANSAPIPDPMQNESTARLQLSVDRARAQSHRLLHKCTAELRKIQTERQFRNEYFKAGTDLSEFGICDWRSVRKSIDQQETASFRNQKAELAILYGTPAPPPEATPVTSSFCKTDSAQVQTPRNADCPCKSGLKYKRCCGQSAPPMLQAA
jgi:SEC-C motif